MLLFGYLVQHDLYLAVACGRLSANLGAPLIYGRYMFKMDENYKVI